jgi:hypothetical protein
MEKHDCFLAGQKQDRRTRGKNVFQDKERRTGNQKNARLAFKPSNLRDIIW